MGRAKQEQLEYLDRINHYLKDDPFYGEDVSEIVEEIEELQEEFREKSAELSKLYRDLDIKKAREIAKELLATLTKICELNDRLADIEDWDRDGESPLSV